MVISSVLTGCLTSRAHTSPCPPAWSSPARGLASTPSLTYPICSAASLPTPNPGSPSCSPTSGRRPGNQPLHPNLPSRPAPSTSLASPEWVYRMDTCQGRSDNSRRAGAGGWTDRGNPAGRWRAPSQRTARCVSEGSMGLPFPYRENCNQPRARRALVRSEA